MDPQLPSSAGAEGKALSKNQLKKLKRDQEWEANRAKRKAKRKEKLQEKKQRKRAAREGLAPSTSATANPASVIIQEHQSSNEQKWKRSDYIRVPITVILDCGFDDLMNDKELKSLGAQVTRSYSDNHKSPFQSHLAISSFGGCLKGRFEGLLEGQYHSWKGVRFLEEDFVQAAEHAKEWMKGDSSGRLAGVFEAKAIADQSVDELIRTGEVVYLTSDSPNTLTELRPYSTYIVGGLVDRNRHKGLCYKRAMERGIRTAKLPIGDYMQMDSRFVLATNHVVEIMLRWLDLGDWGKAFLQVMPKRKGGILKRTTGEIDEQSSREIEEGDVDNGRITNGNRGSAMSDQGHTKGEEDQADGSDEEAVENGGVAIDLQSN